MRTMPARGLIGRVLRASVLLASIAAVQGCSVLDNIRLDGQRQLDPNRVYLDGQIVKVARYRDLDRYACLTGVLQCRQHGISWSCSCP